MSNNPFKLLLTSLEGKFRPIEGISASVEYAINSLPVLSFDLPPTANDVFCNFDGLRRTKVKATIGTPTGCINFTGLIDGLSISQQPGAIRLSLNIKHLWQYLKEIDVRFVGYHPFSSNVFIRLMPVGADGKQQQVTEDILLGALRYSQLTAMKDREGMTAIDGAKEIVMAVIENKERLPDLIAQNPNFSTEIQMMADAIRGTYVQTGKELVSSIVTSFLSKMKIKFGDPGAFELLMQQLKMSSQGSIFDLLLTLFRLFECNLVIGNTAAYVVPDIGFLTMPKRTPGFQEISKTPNIIYPSQYSFFGFNDSGGIDIKAVALTLPVVSGPPAMGVNEMGAFSDPSARGGVLVTSAPVLVGLGINANMTDEYKPLQNVTNSGGGKGNVVPNKTDEKAFKDYAAKIIQSYGTAEEMSVKAQKRVKNFANAWAKLTYLKMKYRDRTGTLNMPFNINVAPGAVGSIYTRHPGVFVDMHVTGVRHSIQINPPDNGSATTTISFNCGRVGLSKSFSEIDLFGYSAANSLQFAQAFVGDIQK